MKTELIIGMLAFGVVSGPVDGRTEKADGWDMPGGIPKVTEAVVVDGDLSDNAWKATPVIRADFIDRKSNVVSAVPRMTVRYAWDEHYLYIGYEVWDTNLVALGTGQENGPADNRRTGCEIYSPTAHVDAVEFLFSFGDSNFVREIRHNALNQFSDVLCVGRIRRGRSASRAWQRMALSSWTTNT